jgi:hypothetical protein
MPSAGLPTLRGMPRLRALSEAECYARCYGTRDDTVRILETEVEPRERYRSTLSGEELRRRFEELLQSRESEAA